MPSITTIYPAANTSEQELPGNVTVMLKSVYDADGDGDVDVAAGGTGANTAAGARTNLGLGTAATANTVDLLASGNHTWTQDGTGAVSRTVHIKLREGAVTVQDFGGVCDGSTDDSAAFALAVATGRPIYIPGGSTVNILATTYTSDLYIFGDGDTSVIKWANTSGSSSLFLFQTNVISATFCNLKIDCNRTAHTDTASYFAAIDMNGASGSSLVLEQVWFDQGRIIDVRVVGPTAGSTLTELVVRNCRFTDGLIGSATRAAQCVAITDGVNVSLQSNFASVPTRPGTYGRAGFVHDGARNGTALRGKYSAIGNRFLNIGRGTADTLGCVDVYYGADDVVMIGNTAIDVCGRFLTTKGDQSRIVRVGNTVNDVFSSVSDVATAYAHFQDLYNTSVDTQFIDSGNVCGASDGYGIFFDGLSPSGTSNFKDILINGFQCGACGIAGIHVRSATNVIISNPIIRGGLSAITFSGITGLFAVRGGSLNDTTSHTINGTNAIAVNDNCDFVVTDTAIYNSAAYAISITKVKSYYIAPSIIDGCTIALITTGSDQASFVRGRFANMSSGLWSKNGTDASVRLFDKDVRTSTGLSFANRSRTISAGAVTVYADWHYIDTEGAAATDDLDTINGGYDGYMLVLRAASSSRDVVVKDGTGNIRLNGDFTLTNAQDSITLFYAGNDWIELARSDNAA